jgi:hypothetical protein
MSEAKSKYVFKRRILIRSGLAEPEQYSAALCMYPSARPDFRIKTDHSLTSATHKHRSRPYVVSNEVWG